MKTVKPAFAGTSMPFNATVVIVLYRVATASSRAFRSVMHAREKLHSHAGQVSILLWDNSPAPQQELHLPYGVQYVSDPRNLGLANAYKRALEISIGQGVEWLITLDQDSAIPPDYFVKMAAAAACRPLNDMPGNAGDDRAADRSGRKAPLPQLRPLRRSASLVSKRLSWRA